VKEETITICNSELPVNFTRHHLASFYSLSQQLLSVREFRMPFEDKVWHSKKYSVVYNMHLLNVVWLLKL